MQYFSQFVYNIMHNFTGFQLSEFQNKKGVDLLIEFLGLPMSKTEIQRVFKCINKFDEISLSKKFAERVKMEFEKLEGQIGKLESLASLPYPAGELIEDIFNLNLKFNDI